MDDNGRIAELLREVATLLAQQGANPYRVNARRKAADTIESPGRSVGVRTPSRFGLLR